jgi:PHD/YefM family antitoxin component YafN of YafNO toxin-antitoxin module
MDTLTITEARTNLYKLVESVGNEHKPTLITGKKNNAILISEQDWNSINETMYLLNIPGMRESIMDGMKEPITSCSQGINW